MSATTRAGEQKVLASYEANEGERQLVAQRVQGTVALSDIPTADHGRVHLVERQLGSLAELETLVADYLQTARRTGRCPMEGWPLPVFAHQQTPCLLEARRHQDWLIAPARPG